MSEYLTDAALRIARWIWPTAEWQLLCGKAHSDTHRVGLDSWSWNDVHFAEGVIIKRGLSEQYGRALLTALGWPWPNDEPVLTSKVAEIATAPLDARVSAILAVIEQQEKRA